MVSHGLPIGQILSYCRITQEVKCPHCPEPEITQHAFFDCFCTQQIWRASNIALPVLYDPMASYEDKLRTLLSDDAKLPKEFQTLGIWILWRVWKVRNMLLFQKNRSTWTTTLPLAKTDNTEWRNAQAYLDTTQVPTMMVAIECRINKWKRPPNGWIKCNYNGSYKATTNIERIGWHFMDSERVFKGAEFTAVAPTNSALEGKF